MPPSLQKPGANDAPAPPAAAPAPSRARFRLPPWRKLRVALGIWATLVAVALVVANALDEPVGSGALDPSQPIVAGAVVDPFGGQPPGPGRRDQELQPLTLKLDEPLPQSVQDLTLAQAVNRLREIAEREDTPLAWVQLGLVQQALPDGAAAQSSYERARSLRRGYLPALVGLVMVDAATGPEGRERAIAGLEELARRRPESQLVQFNLGWVAAYDDDGERTVAALVRTVELDRDSVFGRQAIELLRQIAGQEGGTGTTTEHGGSTAPQFPTTTP